MLPTQNLTPPCRVRNAPRLKFFPKNENCPPPQTAAILHGVGGVARRDEWHDTGVGDAQPGQTVDPQPAGQDNTAGSMCEAVEVPVFNKASLIVAQLQSSPDSEMHPRHLRVKMLRRSFLVATTFTDRFWKLRRNDSFVALTLTLTLTLTPTLILTWSGYQVHFHTPPHWGIQTNTRHRVRDRVRKGGGSGRPSVHFDTTPGGSKDTCHVYYFYIFLIELHKKKRRTSK